MGAYYEATIKNTRYNTHSMDNGLKLMEHSYLENDYCMAIEVMLMKEPSPLVWLCDYHETSNTTALTWENTSEEDVSASIIKEIEVLKTKHRFIINVDKNLYFSTKELMDLSTNEDNWVIHPLPLLTNSDFVSGGGGDYHDTLDWRTAWCGNNISVSFEEPKDMENISSSVFLVENW